MTVGRDDGQDAVQDRLSDAYGAAVGSVMAARTPYDQACAAHGVGRWPVRQAQDDLTREITRRNELRAQYDKVIDR